MPHTAVSYHRSGFWVIVNEYKRYKAVQEQLTFINTHWDLYFRFFKVQKKLSFIWNYIISSFFLWGLVFFFFFFLSIGPSSRKSLQLSAVIGRTIQALSPSPPPVYKTFSSADPWRLLCIKPRSSFPLLFPQVTGKEVWRKRWQVFGSALKNPAVCFCETFRLWAFNVI